MALSADLGQRMRHTRVFFANNLEASVREAVLDKVPHAQEKNHEKSDILMLRELAERLMEAIREAEGDVGEESAIGEKDEIAAEAERVFYEALRVRRVDTREDNILLTYEKNCVAMPLHCMYGGVEKSRETEMVFDMVSYEAVVKLRWVKPMRCITPSACIYDPFPGPWTMSSTVQMKSQVYIDRLAISFFTQACLKWVTNWSFTCAPTYGLAEGILKDYPNLNMSPHRRASS
ncbi:uncharacterized protein F5891DRAFT_987267 [Suillus fuscotomentosus]|uniref:Uncharacterized protein n=1 Tax=Suillus fuscotomentosus TaxID=1912939 RepID=A0AAD4HCZ2_9AGAM|nr:uncharacterized protein F5891DRAFT_987267 [Suillus fuscotomentosus]KAG1889732.1 hypothetical protein F5891DRAFT_987267 [Suillus fuscotomentosus]